MKLLLELNWSLIYIQRQYGHKQRTNPLENNILNFTQIVVQFKQLLKQGVGEQGDDWSCQIGVRTVYNFIKETQLKDS